MAPKDTLLRRGIVRDADGGLRQPVGEKSRHRRVGLQKACHVRQRPESLRTSNGLSFSNLGMTGLQQSEASLNPFENKPPHFSGIVKKILNWPPRKTGEQ
jgi:hypothetical protein